MARWKILRARYFRHHPTPQEAKLWPCLRCHRLSGVKFCRQARLLGYIADFYAPQQKLVVEIDGSVHDERKSQDAYRDAALLKHGIRTIRFPAAMVDEQLLLVLREICRHLRKPQ